MILVKAKASAMGPCFTHWRAFWQRCYSEKAQAFVLLEGHEQRSAEVH